MPRYPYIAQGALHPAEGSGPIAIGSPAWSAWIREHTTFAYQDEPLRFTARREQRPGGLYWYAYKRAHGKLLKRYLGRGEDLTLQRFLLFCALEKVTHKYSRSVGSAHPNLKTVPEGLDALTPSRTSGLFEKHVVERGPRT